jgi:hypothetical protein
MARAHIACEQQQAAENDPYRFMIYYLEVLCFGGY